MLCISGFVYDVIFHSVANHKYATAVLPRPKVTIKTNGKSPRESIDIIRVLL